MNGTHSPSSCPALIPGCPRWLRPGHILFKTGSQAWLDNSASGELQKMPDPYRISASGSGTQASVRLKASQVVSVCIQGSDLFFYLGLPTNPSSYVTAPLAEVP